MYDEEVIRIACAFLREEESCSLHAYPDPGSPMAQAMPYKTFRQILRTGEVPQVYSHLSGEPWTIGYGETRGVVRGMVWTQAQAEAALRSAVEGFLRKARRMWPGMDQLRPSAQAALTSLVYNRGTSLKKNDRRREMRLLGPAILAQDYVRIAELIRSMKRLWVGKGLDGLLARRDAEADMVLAHV